MTGRNISTACCLFLSISILACFGCKKGDPIMKETTDSVYKVGQVWNYNSRPREEKSTLTIVKVESHEKLGVIVHVCLQGLKIKNPQTPSGISNTIPHAPFSEKAIQESVTKLNRITQDLPDFKEGYNSWRDAQGGIWTISVSDAIATVEKCLNKN